MKTYRSPPYVGVTGVATHEEVEHAVTCFREAGFSMAKSHIPMLGILVSYKTLNGQATANLRYPPVERVPELLSTASRRVLTMLHYNSRERETLVEQIGKLFNTGDIFARDTCTALQLNIPWPEPKQVWRIKESFPRMMIVLQLSRDAMKDKTVDEICRRTSEYAGMTHYALIDPSSGAGRPFDFKHSRAVFEGLRKHCPTLAVGLAGGFDGSNVEERVTMLEPHIGLEFCIDAEGGVRDKRSDEYGDDTYHREKVKAYIDAAGRAFLGAT